METCNIDLGALDTVEEDTAFFSGIVDYLQNVGADCSAAETEVFDDALSDFKTCAGFDLEAFIENFPSATLGTLLECVLSTDVSNVKDWSNPEEYSKIKISEKCLTFEYGHNAFGDGFRHMALSPDKVTGCFKEMSSKIPNCSTGEWPIPLIGAWLNTASCVLGELPELYDEWFTAELKAWDQCLPTNEGTCATTCPDAMLVGEGQYSLPVSDALERLAAEENYEDALKRYENYLKDCTVLWTSWDDLSTDAKVSDVGTSSPGLSGFWLFTGGFFAGAILLKAYLIYQAREQRDVVNMVELSGLKELDETKENSFI